MDGWMDRWGGSIIALYCHLKYMLYVCVVLELRGTMNVRGETVANCRDVFVATFAGHKLINKDGFFGKSDPFFNISRCKFFFHILFHSFGVNVLPPILCL